MPDFMSVPPISPVVYSASCEQMEENEAETDNNINETMAKIREKTYSDTGTPLRSVHAKSHGVVTGEIKIAENLPAVLAQGLFAKPATYPVVMRFSTTPGDIMADTVSTPRGLAIKVIGVEGARVTGSEGDVTQDFVLVNGPAFQRPGVKGFLMDLKMLAPTTDKMEGVKKVASAVARGTEAVLEAFGTKSAKLNSLGGQQITHILGETFYSQVPILFGPYIAKVAAVPTTATLTELTGAPLDLDGKPDGIREAVTDYFLKHGGSWDVRVQLCADLETMPVEDASVLWPEDQSPFLTVATITVAPQDSWTAQKVEAIDQGLLFSPWHALAEHRPLGSVMRARKVAYEQSAQFRAAKAW